MAPKNSISSSIYFLSKVSEKYKEYKPNDFLTYFNCCSVENKQKTMKCIIQQNFQIYLPLNISDKVGCLNALCLVTFLVPRQTFSGAAECVGEVCGVSFSFFFFVGGSSCLVFFFPLDFLGDILGIDFTPVKPTCLVCLDNFAAFILFLYLEWAVRM